MKLLSSALLVSGLVVSLFVSQGVSTESNVSSKAAKFEVLTDFEEAVEVANKTNKPVFVYVLDSV